MTGYLYLLMAVGFVGWSICIFLLGRLGGIQDERRRSARVRRMQQNWRDAR